MEKHKVDQIVVAVRDRRDGGLLVRELLECRLKGVCIMLESAGPVFYRQERVGQGGGVFTVCKFRSMHNEAERDGKPRWASANDDRTTRVGRIIRKLRIDELPQIIRDASELVDARSTLRLRPNRGCGLSKVYGPVLWLG